MSGKVSKRLRRFAENKSIGEKSSVTRKLYRKMKKNYHNGVLLNG